MVALLGCAPANTAVAPSPHLPRSDGEGVRLGTATEARLTAEGAAIGVVHIALLAIGRAGSLEPARRVEPLIDGVEVRYERAPGVIEWWRSVEAGLEQGVTIERRPDGEGALRLEMSVGESVRADTDGHDSIALRDLEGVRLATYSHLVVLDADGRTIPAHMTGAGDRIAIVVDDDAARYPLVVDPIVTVLERLITPASAERSLGQAVALSRAGDFAVSYSSTTGRALRRLGTTWEDEGDGVSGFSFSTHITMSGDGTRVCWNGQILRRSGAGWGADGVPAMALAIAPNGARAVGYPNSGGPTNRVVFLRRTGATWAQEVSLTTSSTPGQAVMSGDGTRAVVAVDGVTGYSYNGTTWISEGAVTGTGAGPADGYGAALAMSEDGSRLAISGPNDGSGAGSVWVFVRSGSVWAEEVRLGASARGLGGALAINADGSRIAAGTDTSAATPTVVIYDRTPGGWSERGQLSGSSGFGTSVAMSGDGTRLLVGAPSGTFPFGAAHIYRLGANGDPCTVAAGCDSGFCSDGVCCSSDCGVDGSDCRACSAAAGTTTNGSCGALTAAVAAATICRASGGVCDPADTCTAGSTACPVNTRHGTAVTCRASGGECDVAEVCDGIGDGCPPDDRMPGTTICHASTGPCDPAENCEGGVACPADRLAASGTMCASSSGAPCDVPDVCDGTSAACPSLFAPAGTVCLASSGGVCDAPDACTGTSADCMPTFLASVECRASSGGCDPAELCSGGEANCPPDQFSPSGTVCRASTESCDPAESCDGAAASCPADVNACVLADGGGADAGDGGARDGSTAVGDAGPPPTPAAGCTCRASPRPAPGGLAMVFAALVASLLRRRRLR